MSKNNFCSSIFNFLDHRLTPSVSCSSPAMDNYEVDNLLSENSSKRNLGFLAYSAIKPPIEIEFKFICPIEICYILLRTTVGSQKSTGIEIMCKTENIDYTYVSKAVFTQSGVIFCNSRLYSNDKFPERHNPDIFYLAYFNSGSYKVFKESTCLKLKIFQTEKSVPCLGGIEVWGIPAKCCSKVTVNTISHIMTKATHTVTNVVNTQDKLSIPEDFKDDLTYELMTIPFTLPSGKTIDQVTLDKHIEIEAQFGRKPCDPFTGIKFTDQLKPILNVALKSRIDMFILQNSSYLGFSNHKRILGKEDLKNGSIENKMKKAKVTENADLEEAISRIKESPDFINITNVASNNCTRCDKKYCFLYQISCQHLHCRKCLIEISKVYKCSLCHKKFNSKDVKKCNL